MSDLYNQWKKDEQAPFRGWDFSYLKGRGVDEKPSWDYKKIAKELLSKSASVLDMGTGGGEVLSSLAPFPKHTVATEAYKPNVEVAKKRLEPLSVQVVEVDESCQLPFKNNEFNLILNRHSAYDENEVFRVLKPRGIFLTQQVSGDNLKDLLSEFETTSKFENSWTFEIAVGKLRKAGFTILQTKQWQGKLEFNDVGALVYYLKAIPWIVSGFSVGTHKKYLEKLQQRLEKEGTLFFTQTRFLVEAKK